jgi:hypothetical protein
MIHLLNYSFRCILMCLFSATVGLGTLLLAIILWDGRFMDLGSEMQGLVWNNQ